MTTSPSIIKRLAQGAMDGMAQAVETIVDPFPASDVLNAILHVLSINLQLEKKRWRRLTPVERAQNEIAVCEALNTIITELTYAPNQQLM